MRKLNLKRKNDKMEKIKQELKEMMTKEQFKEYLLRNIDKEYKKYVIDTTDQIYRRYYT